MTSFKLLIMAHHQNYESQRHANMKCNLRVHMIQ